MEKIDFKDKKVTVMGIGLHGGAVSMIKWLLSQGARVVATDIKSNEDLQKSLENLKGLKNLTIVTGQHRMEDFEHVDMVIKNPAVRWDNKYIKAALEKKVPVEMDASLFFKLCPSKNIIGITGTKGKTTTSTLVYEIIKTAGKKVVNVGIGQEAVMNKLSEIDKDTYVVFELSSWRLSALGRAGISPHIAVLTNIYQDHLNYYPSLKEYLADKKNIYLYQVKQDYLVFNLDNDETATMAQEAKGTVVGYSRKIIPAQVKSSLKDSFSEDDLQSDGVYEGLDHVYYKLGPDSAALFHTSELELMGDHNVSNVLAAVAVGLIVGISPDVIATSVINFKGNPHRLELVKEINEVKFYNDTAATTPEAAIAAINTFSETTNLICGGSNKNLDLTELAKQIAEKDHIKRVFLLHGEATETLQKLILKLSAQKKVVGVYDSMQQAVESAYLKSNRGEVILLSPGCASFGMFQNEFDRGDKFKMAVEDLAA